MILRALQLSTNDLIILFVGPMNRWRLPKDLLLEILSFADILRVGTRSLCFKLHNRPLSRKYIMWKNKCQKKQNALVQRAAERQRSVANHVSGQNGWPT